MLIKGFWRGTLRASTLVAAGAAISMIAVGCSSDYWPQAGSGEPTSAATASAAPTSAPESELVPSISADQFTQIIADVSSVAAAADAAGDASLLEPRFEGPALALRQSTYAIRASFPEYAAPAAVPSGPVQILLPQTTDEWPKVVFAVVGGDDPNVAPTALVLKQDSARSNYKVYYEIALEPNVQLPEVAASTVGTTRLSDDSKLISLTPNEVKTAYSDVLLAGDASQYAGLVDPTNDTLRSQVGVDYKNAAKAGIEATASLEFTTTTATGEDVALTTSDSGALVTVNIGEKTTVKPTTAGATVSPKGAVLALSKVDSSLKGVEADYDYQLLFYVPPQGTDQPRAQLLGFTQGLLTASELP